MFASNIHRNARLLVSQRSSLPENLFEEYWQEISPVLFVRLNHDLIHARPHARTRAQEIESFRERYTSAKRRAVSKRTQSLSSHPAIRIKNPREIFSRIIINSSPPGTFSTFPRRTSPRGEAKVQSVIFQ